MDYALLLAISPILIGWALDLCLGDPTWLPHPVVGFGKLISVGEQRLNKGTHKRLKGGLWAIVCILAAYTVPALFLQPPHFNPWLHIQDSPYIPIIYIGTSSILFFFCLAGKTLRHEVRMVFEASSHSVEDGRKQLSRIVGRDTGGLSLQEIRTAALETLAENLSDGIIAPLFWFALLGIPGMTAYKMVNTLDSMIGYRTERYKEFGFLAAKIDDVANYIPARLTALLMVLAGKALTGRKGLLGFVLHFSSHHASPNSGWPEAALAGILNCRFGGGHYYFNEYLYKPYIGTTVRPLTTTDMAFSLKIAFICEIASIAAILILCSAVCFILK